MPATVNLDIRQGATYRRGFIWSAGDPLALVDLTGCTARMQIRRSIANPATLAVLTTENGGVTLGGATGRIDLLLSAAATAALPACIAVYDLEVVHPDASVTTLIQGQVLITPEVTR